MRPVSTEHPKPQRDAWEISASFFSTRLHHTVSQVSMTYAGQDLERALRAFVGRLGAEMPDVPCRGWDQSTQVNAGALRRMLDD
jgi:energy-converting hydrogenase Eha subunit A